MSEAVTYTAQPGFRAGAGDEGTAELPLYADMPKWARFRLILMPFSVIVTLVLVTLVSVRTGCPISKWQGRMCKVLPQPAPS
jgi:hypothetical protein